MILSDTEVVERFPFTRVVQALNCCPTRPEAELITDTQLMTLDPTTGLNPERVFGRRFKFAILNTTVTPKSTNHIYLVGA